MTALRVLLATDREHIGDQSPVLKSAPGEYLAQAHGDEGKEELLSLCLRGAGGCLSEISWRRADPSVIDREAAQQAGCRLLLPPVI